MSEPKKVISAKAVQSADKKCAILNLKCRGCNTEILLAPSEFLRFSDLQAWKLPSLITGSLCQKEENNKETTEEIISPFDWWLALSIPKFKLKSVSTTGPISSSKPSPLSFEPTTAKKKTKRTIRRKNRRKKTCKPHHGCNALTTMEKSKTTMKIMKWWPQQMMTRMMTIVKKCAAAHSTAVSRCYKANSGYVCLNT